MAAKHCQRPRHAPEFPLRKDPAEHVLSLDEVRTCCRIVTALARTSQIQGEIDALYAAAEDVVTALP